MNGNNHRDRRGRLFLGLALLGGGGLALLAALWAASWGRAGDSRVVLAADGVAPHSAREAPSILQIPIPTGQALEVGQREAHAVEGVLASVEVDLHKPKQVPVDTEGATLIHVQLTDQEGQPLHLAGLDVEVQSWLEDTSETHRYHVLTDDQGKGTLAFEGMLHVDWFKHEPADGSGIPFLLAEFHEDVAAGEAWSANLIVFPGGSVHGRVVDTSGHPLGGVEVHLFLEYYMGVVEDVWRPGVTSVVTNQLGDFHFPSLAARDWSLAIPPLADWLQVVPSLVEGKEQVSQFDLEAGTVHDVGTLVVAPLERLEVRVVDLGGSPVTQANIWLEPIALDLPGIFLPQAEEVDEIDRWLRGEDPWTSSGATGQIWSYEAPSAISDEDGRAVLLATRGAWKLCVRSGRDIGSQPAFDEALEVALPCAPQEVRVPARFVPFAGRVVDLKGAPIADLSVIAAASQELFAPGLVAETDEAGVFRFRELPLGKPLWIHLRGSDVLPAIHRIQVTDREGATSSVDPADLPTFAARRSATLSVQLEYPGGRNRSAWLQIRPLTRASVQPALTRTEQLYGESLAEKPQLSQSIVHGLNTLRVSGLLPGRYEVAVMVKSGTGSYRADTGAPLTRGKLWQREVFVTDDPTQILEIDLSGYELPPKQPGVQWSGIVRDSQSGEPVGGAGLRIKGQDWSRSTWTSNAGKFRFLCPDAGFRVEVTREGYEYFSESYASAGSLGDSVSIDLSPCQTELTLQVRTKEGEPIPEARLDLFDGNGQPAHASFGNRRNFRSSGWLSPTEHLVVRFLKPGRWQVAINCQGVFLGEHWIELAPGSERQDMLITLGMTADALRELVRTERN